MKISLTQFLTLDSVYQSPGGPNEDPSDGFEYGGWQVPYGDKEFGRFMTEVFDRADGFLLGRRTYDIFAAHWPKVTDPADPIASRLNALPKYVASTTLTSASWQGTRIVGQNNLVEDVTALKEQDGRELQLHGSGALAGILLKHDLIDTLHLLTFPVILGAGKRLFTEGVLPTAFEHTEARTTGTGVVINTYERSGRPTYGAYQLDE